MTMKFAGKPLFHHLTSLSHFTHFS